MTLKMSLRFAVAVAVSLTIVASLLHVNYSELEHVTVSSRSVDLFSSYRVRGAQERGKYANNKVEGIRSALIIFACIMVVSCFPCLLLWWRLYRELGMGKASWGKPSSLLPFNDAPVMRPTSPVTYSAAAPSPMMIRSA